MKDSDVDSLLWSLLILALGGAILFMWNAQLPAPLLWAGYIGIVIGVILLVRWWYGVIR